MQQNKRDSALQTANSATKILTNYEKQRSWEQRRQITVCIVEAECWEDSLSFSSKSSEQEQWQTRRSIWIAVAITSKSEEEQSNIWEIVT